MYIILEYTFHRNISHPIITPASSTGTRNVEYTAEIIMCLNNSDTNM